MDKEDIQEHIPRPRLVYVPEEAFDGQNETRDAETQRLERNKVAKATAEAKLKGEMKKRNELRVGGLDNAAANPKAKSVLFMVLGMEDQTK